jgi:hypothetical protein
MKRFFQLFLMLCVGPGAFAQSSPYENDVYSPAIKSVEFYNAKKQGSFPIINLNSGEQLFLAFDDLRGGSENYYYTIEHCDGDWNSSNLAITDYLLGPSEDRINDYNYSSATLQKYTHYTLKFPNEIIRPKISGNYILKVYEDDDPTKIVLTRKMYVVNNKMSVGAEMVASQNQDTRLSNQKINFTINYGNLQVQNPNADIRTLIMQNGRDETGVFTTQVQYIRGNQLIYGDLSTNDFPGNNEFRHFDTRSLRINSDRVTKIIRDTANTVLLLTDGSRNQPNYIFLYDNDGKFFIINNDGTNPVIDADYAHMYISLDAGKTDADGSAYIVGKFNDYKLDARSKLDYDPRGKFYTHLFLKQGVYDYEYVWVDKATNKPDDTFLEGSYYDTENSYQILVYYKPPAARWEELVAYRGLSTAK